MGWGSDAIAASAREARFQISLVLVASYRGSGTTAWSTISARTMMLVPAFMKEHAGGDRPGLCQGHRQADVGMLGQQRRADGMRRMVIDNAGGDRHAGWSYSARPAGRPNDSGRGIDLDSAPRST